VSNHPNTILYLSSILPRTFAKHSNLTEPQVNKYNETAKRHGLRLRSRATDAGYECILTSILWKTISNHKEEPKYYLLDGLHLTPEGTMGIAKEWLSAILPPTCDVVPSEADDQ
jgi:hypothetical protein